ncbi:MAG: hypothetical protein IT558_02735 [Alphaproteobacteria bacterium]|nr:hypothetical protein [Alphaproteobacteria bacterium]
MNRNTTIIIVTLLVLVLGFAAFNALNAPDTRSPGEKLGDAVDQLDNGVDNAARELEDRTPAERIKDDINDATDND